MRCFSSEMTFQFYGSHVETPFHLCGTLDKEKIVAHDLEQSINIDRCMDEGKDGRGK
jgi:hypothetical protein